MSTRTYEFTNDGTTYLIVLSAVRLVTLSAATNEKACLRVRWNGVDSDNRIETTMPAKEARRVYDDLKVQLNQSPEAGR